MENTKKSRADLKKYFVKNAMPTASHFADVIDAAINQRDDGLAKPAGEPLSLEASAAGKRTALRIFEAFPDASPAWTIDLLDAMNRKSLVVGDGTNARLAIDRVSGEVRVGALSASGLLRADEGLTVGTFAVDVAPVIKARLMPNDQGGANERTELILFHGNDGTNGFGPDTITLRAPAIRLQTFDDGSVSDIDNPAGSKDRFVIDPGGNVTVSSGALSVGTSTAVARLDVAQAVRTALHPSSINGAYITGDFGADFDGVEFRHSNGSQGIGFGYNTIYAAGSNPDQNLALKARGSGIVEVLGGLRVTSGPLTVDSLTASGATITVANGKTLAADAITSNAITTSGLVTANAGLTVTSGKVKIGSASDMDQVKLRVYGPNVQGQWCGRITSGGDGDTVVIGAWNGRAMIGAHNTALTEWASLSINDGGGEVSVGGLLRANEGLTVASGKTLSADTLTASGATITVASDKTLAAGAITASGLITASEGLTVASGKTLRVDGVADLGVVRRRTAPFKVEGVKTSFYPVVFTDDGWDDGAFVLELSRTDVHTDSAWEGSLVARFRLHASNFGHGSDFDEVELYQSENRRFIARYRTLIQAAKLVVWLRGGTTYFWRANHNASLSSNEARATTLNDEALDVLDKIDENLDLTRLSIGPALASTSVRSRLAVSGLITAGEGLTVASGKTLSADTLTASSATITVANDKTLSTGAITAGAITAGGLVTASEGLTVASGKTLSAGAITASAITTDGLTVTSGALSADRLTASGATISVANGKTLAADAITSNAITASGLVTANAGLTVTSGKVKIGSASDMEQVKLRVYGPHVQDQWCGRITSGGDGDTVVIGALNGRAMIGAHNNALRAWAPLYINEDGGEVSVGGLLKANQGLMVASGKTLSADTLSASGATITVASGKTLAVGAITASGLVTANEGLTVASDKALTAGAIAASGLTVAGGTLSVGTTTTVARLDIAQAPRSAWNNIAHPTSIKGAYITGDFGPDSEGVEFRHSNGSQGIGFGYNTIYAAGSLPDQDLGLKPRGNGLVKVYGNRLVASCVEVGGPGPTPGSGQATMILHHHGVRGNQLRYNDGTLYLEAVTNGWATTTTPNLTVGGTVTAGTLSVGTLTEDTAPVITARLMPPDQGGSNERTELILFHGNDGTNGYGPDTITLRAPTIRLQTFNDPKVSDIGNKAGSNDRLVIDPGGNITFNGCLTAPFVITGTGQNRNGGNDLSIVKIGGAFVVNTMARGLTLVVLSRATHTVESNTTYDTWESEANATALATALNGLTDKIGILVSCDAWEKRVTDGLKQAFQRLGLVKASGVVDSDLRRPYAAIFEANEVENARTSKAIEVLNPAAGSPPAHIRGWLMDGSF